MHIPRRVVTVQNIKGTRVSPSRVSHRVLVANRVRDNCHRKSDLRRYAGDSNGFGPEFAETTVAGGPRSCPRRVHQNRRRTFAVTPRFQKPDRGGRRRVCHAYGELNSKSERLPRAPLVVHQRFTVGKRIGCAFSRRRRANERTRYIHVSRERPHDARSRDDN